MNQTVMGIDMGGTQIRGAIVDGAGTLVAQWQESTPARTGRAEVVQRLFAVIDHLKDQGPVGIGVGTPGIIDRTSGCVIGASPNIADWPGTPLKQLIQERYHLPVEVENDVNAITLGEARFGQMQGRDNFACIAIGTGVGIGIVLNREIFAGAHELGHSIVNCDGPVCGCGRQGCVEASVSGLWVSRRYRELAEKAGRPVDETLKASAVFEKAQSGEPEARKIADDFICALASVMANIILFYSITDFLITGGVSQAFPLFQDRLIKEVRIRSISHLNEALDVRVGGLNDVAGILGAASLIFAKV